MKLVSIVVPCYNEEARIGALLEAITEQTYGCEHMEVVLADGMSTDRTRELACNPKPKAEHPFGG